MSPESTTSILALFQISDSGFPSGTFTHSLGLEQSVRGRVVTTSAGLERWVVSVIERSTAGSDALASASALRAALRDDVPSVVAIDRELAALKTATELRRASTETGRRLLDEVAAHHDTPSLEGFRAEVHAGRSPGTQPVVLGVVASTFDVDPVTVAAVVMQGAANAVLQAAMRLFPVSHRDVQGVLHRLRPRIAALAQTAATSGAPLHSFHPLQDIASMQHESAPARLFAS